VALPLAKAVEADSKGEPLYAPPLAVEPVSAVRGSVIVLDWLWLRECGHFERYAAALGAARGLLEVSSTEWVPFPDAAEHWRALDALRLGEEQEYAIGRFNGERVHNIVLATMIRLAGAVGVTPWAALAQCHKLWLRSWKGGGMAVYRAGKCTARIEILGAPILRHSQFRNGMMGAIEAGIAPFCKQPVAQELTAERTPSSIAVRASWQG
jgi:hypothetical protein